MLKLENNKSNSNKKAFIQLGIMLFLTILTQIVMLMKNSVIASRFGISVEMDAFNFTNSIGTFIFSFIGAGVTTILIPNMINNYKKKSINTFISVLYSAGFIVLILMYFGRRFLVSNLSTGSVEFIDIACGVMLITLITQFLSSFIGVTNAVFQCSGKFNLPKVITLVTNIILVLLILFIPNIDIYKYAFYMLITTLLNVIVQIGLALKGGFKYAFNYYLKDIHFIEMVKSFCPIVLSTGLYQVSLVTDTIISSRLGDGQISILTYSNSIMGMINALLLVNIMTYLYPKIAESIKKENSHKNLFDLFILLGAIMCLMVVGFFIVGQDGISVLYERGEFSSNSTYVVYICSLIYMIGLPINALRDLIYRYFYAKGDTKTPFKNSLIISMLNIIISVVLSYIMGIYGIILGTVITAFMSLGMILYRFNRRFTIRYDKKVLFLEIFKIVLSSMIVIAVVTIFKNCMPTMIPIINIVFYGLIVILLYSISLYFFKSIIFKIKL